MIGFYKDNSGTESCVPCPPGTSTSGTAMEAASACEKCPAGKYVPTQPILGKRLCLDCPANSASQEGSVACACNEGYRGDQCFIKDPTGNSRRFQLRFNMLVQADFNSLTQAFDVDNTKLSAFVSASAQRISVFFGIGEDEVTIETPELIVPVRRSQDASFAVTAILFTDHEQYTAEFLSRLQAALEAYLNTDITFPTVSCGQGHFQAEGGCSPCAPGYYQESLESADSCSKCPSDHMESAVGSTSETDCRCITGYAWGPVKEESNEDQLDPVQNSSVTVVKRASRRWRVLKGIFWQRRSGNSTKFQCKYISRSFRLIYGEFSIILYTLSIPKIDVEVRSIDAGVMWHSS
jgi:hypothetical protein